ncbi:MAG: hypothetical protein ACRYGP_11340 [Janthinobacterium lividum]
MPARALSLVAAEATRHPPSDIDRGEADAVILVQRVGRELTGLSAAVEELQGALGPALAQAAADDPQLMQQAQTLDLVAQSLQGLSHFLAAVGRLRIGHEPLDIEGVAATLTLASLGERLAGRAPGSACGDFDLF